MTRTVGKEQTSSLFAHKLLLLYAGVAALPFSSCQERLQVPGTGFFPSMLDASSKRLLAVAATHAAIGLAVGLWLGRRNLVARVVQALQTAGGRVEQAADGRVEQAPGAAPRAKAHKWKSIKAVGHGVLDAMRLHSVERETCPRSIFDEMDANGYPVKAAP
jgi:hypothetical protein